MGKFLSGNYYKEVENYGKQYNYFYNILQFYVGIPIDMSKDEDLKLNVWNFDENEVGCFFFSKGNFEVFATPFVETKEGIPYAVFNNGEI